MSTFEKRTSLEEFTRAQIIGPGAFNKRFFLLSKWDQSEFNGQNLNRCSPLQNQSEVIAEVPAYLYSSGILFPITKVEMSESTVTTKPKSEVLNDQYEEQETTPPKLEDENFIDDHTESISSKNQNYPNTCGIAFAIDDKSNISEDLQVNIKFRAYRKLKQHECQENKLGYWVNQNTKEVVQIFREYFANIFDTLELDGNHFVFLLPSVDINEHLNKLDYDNCDKLFRNQVQPLLDRCFPDKQYYEKATRTYNNETFDIIIPYEQSIIEVIQNNLLNDRNTLGEYTELIKYLEIYKQVKEIVTELKTIHRKSSVRILPTPIWEAKSYNIPVRLESFSEKEIKRGELRLVEADNLSVRYQYVRHKNHLNRSLVYVKLVLVNKNLIKLKEDEPPQLNKKDKANERSYFGVELEVTENHSGVLQPYNPPNLLKLDEESDFNKILFRQYKDYGEGYNCSVKWKNEKKIVSVSSEFLPEQESPQIDHGSSGTTGDLSFRKLGTLSSNSDQSILTTLKEFADKYLQWIDEKATEIPSLNLADQELDLVTRQLKACRSDYTRLKRNINLLGRSTSAMSAFRVMNTAMFLQLHHGKMVKELQRSKNSTYIPEENSANYYSSIKLKHEYCWRPFQLAFILLNIDAFVQPDVEERCVEDVFQTGWPERNELADMVWFPTGGGKTEAYLGLIAFTIAFRRFTKKQFSGGTVVLMRYTLRLLTLQQFQRATLLICALESMRMNAFAIPHNLSLGTERITIGLFVGQTSLPNTWEQMMTELQKISEQLKSNGTKNGIKTRLPFTECPWCGGALFKNELLENVSPFKDSYGIEDNLKVVCNTANCNYYSQRPHEDYCLPFKLFDEDIYKRPPSLLFGTVDKFAALANKVATTASNRDEDSRRLFGFGYKYQVDPPELIIQDELHLLLGPLGSAVGLYEKSIDELCTRSIDGQAIRPKIITSTATTRNTDSQVFALFDRRSNIFPKQGISCEDSFFAQYKATQDGSGNYDSNRKYVGVLPVGKTQVWMHLRIASIVLVHRLKYIGEKLSLEDIITKSNAYSQIKQTLDYSHTLVSYFNSLKEVGKTQSQLNHYLPGDINLITRNTMQWRFLVEIIKKDSEVDSAELTGRLTGEEVKSNMTKIQRTWEPLNVQVPPEYVIATNMISVGLDIGRLNTMIITSMPRNLAEYIQASSRVARETKGIVFTVHHPFRSRDISHYQRFKEFHEKLYSYVEPISVTPFAHKALERYWAMVLAVLIRHSKSLKLSNNDEARGLDQDKVDQIKESIRKSIQTLLDHYKKLSKYLNTRTEGIRYRLESDLEQITVEVIVHKSEELLNDRWLLRIADEPHSPFQFRSSESRSSLFEPRKVIALHQNWKVGQSLREIAPTAVIKTVQQ